MMMVEDDTNTDDASDDDTYDVLQTGNTKNHKSLNP